MRAGVENFKSVQPFGICLRPGAPPHAGWSTPINSIITLQRRPQFSQNFAQTSGILAPIYNQSLQFPGHSTWGAAGFGETSGKICRNL
jgi:hypothetical protein